MDFIFHNKSQEISMQEPEYQSWFAELFIIPKFQAENFE